MLSYLQVPSYSQEPFCIFFKVKWNATAFQSVVQERSVLCYIRKHKQSWQIYTQIILIFNRLIYIINLYTPHSHLRIFIYIRKKEEENKIVWEKGTTEVNGEYMHFNLRNLRTHPHTLYSFTAITHKVCINTSKSSKAVLSKQHLSFTYVSTQISIQN